MKKIKEILKSIEAKIFAAFDWIANLAIVQWLTQETRLYWMIIGLITGLTSCNWYNACHSGVITAIFYVVYYRIEYKRDHSWLTMLLVLLCSVLGQGIVQLLTER